MGLDMYLTASRHTYRSPYEDQPDYPKPDLDAVTSVLRDISVPDAFDTFGMRTFECTAMYWRKANEIHRWFVDNLQGGEDDCRSYYVSIEQLRQLRNDIRQVLDNPDKAKDVMPTMSGCFFGETGYEGYYFDSLMDTEKRLTKILDLPKEELEKWSFEYQSSW